MSRANIHLFSMGSSGASLCYVVCTFFSMLHNATTYDMSPGTTENNVWWLCVSETNKSHRSPSDQISWLMSITDLCSLTYIYDRGNPRQHVQYFPRPESGLTHLSHSCSSTNCAMRIRNDLVFFTFAFICIFKLHNPEAPATEVRKLIVHLHTLLTKLSPTG